jgi:tryptophan-rich sensory protein
VDDVVCRYRGDLGSDDRQVAYHRRGRFKSHKLGPSAVVAGALAVSSADLARRAAAADPKFGAALAPYPLWCSFATLMSTDIWRLNH